MPSIHLRTRRPSLAPKALLFTLSLTLLAGVAGAGPAMDDSPRARAHRFEALLGFGDLVVGGTVEPHWLADGSSFWISTGTSPEEVAVRIDPVSGERSPLLDAGRLRGALTELPRQPLTGPLALTAFTFDEATGTARFEIDGRPFVLALADNSLRELPAPTAAEAARTRPAAGELPAPNGRWIARVDGGDLWLRSTEDGRPERVTEDGSEASAWDLTAARWSPDGYRLALFKTDLGAVHRLPVVHWLGRQEEVEWQPYPMVGGPQPQSRLYVVDVLARKAVGVDVGDQPDQLLYPLGWRAGADERTQQLVLLRLDRAMKHLDLLLADPRTGATRAVVRETSDTFIEGLRFWDVAEDYYVPLADGERFLWRSERDGRSDLFLYDHDGHLLRRLTDGSHTDSVPLVERVVAVDDAAGEVFFLGQGGDAHPYDRHLYRVGLDGRGLTRLTEAPGVHEVQVSPSYQVFVDTHSAPDRPPRSELRRIDGSLVTELARADVSALDALGWQPPEQVSAKAADGETDLYGVLYKPTGFDPARRYPLVEVIYGGPQGSVTPRRFVPGETCHFAQALAQLGFVTAVLDGRGTPGRGKAFQDVVYRNVGRHEIPDHAAMLRQLAAGRPYVDLDRVGIWGKSWGGYFALRGMLQAPDLYRVGVSWAPVVELESVETAAVEPYMERPVDNPEGYAFASNLPRAGALTGKLLMIIGTADRNTPFAHTMRMVDALVRADEPVDLLVLPEQHHWPEGQSLRYLFSRVRRYFVDGLGTDRQPPLGAAPSDGKGHQEALP